MANPCQSNYRQTGDGIPLYRCCCYPVSAPSPPKRRAEPIFQAYIKAPVSRPLHCPSHKCDSCLNEYFETALRDGYSRLFRDQKDSLDMGRPNAVVTSPNITINDEQMMVMQEEAINKLKESKEEIRKRYAMMQMNDGVWILGGYVIDPQTGKRNAPKQDYFYDNKNKELIAIPPVPGEGRIGFGLAATDNDQIISVGGHNFQYQTMSTVTMLDTNADKFVWEKLPDMPDGTVGPGVSVIDNVLYVIGGFDFIGPNTVCHGDAISMDLDERQWKNLPGLDPPRARPLISIADHTSPPSLIVAGGYNFTEKGKAVPCKFLRVMMIKHISAYRGSDGKIEEYDSEAKTWTAVADIPQFRASNGLATKSNKLYLMDTNVETGQTRLVKEYNMETRRWESAPNLDESKKRSKKSSHSSHQPTIKEEEPKPASSVSKLTQPR